MAAPWLQSRFGVGGALMLLPTALLGSTGVSSILGTVQARAILRVTEGGLKASIHRGLWEQAIMASVLLWVGPTRCLNRIGCAVVVPDESAIRLPDS